MIFGFFGSPLRGKVGLWTAFCFVFSVKMDFISLREVDRKLALNSVNLSSISPHNPGFQAD